MIRKGLWISSGFLAAMFGLSLWAKNQLPADGKFATHWNANGVADGFSGPAVVLWMMPAMAAGIALVLAVVPQLDPRKKNLLRSSLPYLIAWTGTMLVMAVAHAMTVLGAIGHIDMSQVASGPGMIRGLMIVMGAFFAVLGAVLGKVRPNWFMGIRTPWTLSSDLSWDKTHRLGGWLFMLSGIGTVICALVLEANWSLYVLLAGAMASVVISVIYSWVVWKNDPVRETLIPEEAE